MSKASRSPLPIILASADRKIWITDQEAQLLAGLDPASGKLLSHPTPDDKPDIVDAAAAFVAVSKPFGTSSRVLLISGRISAQGRELRRPRAHAGALRPSRRSPLPGKSVARTKFGRSSRPSPSHRSCDLRS